MRKLADFDLCTARPVLRPVLYLPAMRARGVVQAFDWTPPGGPTAKFVCEEWSRSVDEPKVETVRAAFKQVFDLAWVECFEFNGNGQLLRPRPNCRPRLAC